MPTKKPRLNITLEQRSYDVIKSISETSGRPMSSFVSELLEGAMPTLERMAVTFQKIKNAQDVERTTFLAAVDDAQAVIEPLVMEAIGQFDMFMGKIDAAVDGRRMPAPAGAFRPSAAASSPLTNRGVTPKKQTHTKPSNSKGLKVVSKKEVLKKVSIANEHKPRGKSHAV